MTAEGLRASRPPLTAEEGINDRTPCTFRTVDAERIAVSSPTHACTAPCVTSASRTVPHRGWMCSRTMLAYRSDVDGLRSTLPASQVLARSPTVPTDRAGSTYEPPSLADS